jgi:hypothetical protein
MKKSLAVAALSALVIVAGWYLLPAAANAG